MSNIGNKNSILLKARDISRPLISVEEDKTLLDIRNIILRYNISRVAISKNQNIIGIITEKDISKFLYEHAPDRKRLSEINVRELLQNRSELITVNQESTLSFCAKSMLNNNISSLFLINNEGKIDEIITKTDLVEVFAYHYTGYFSVNECMTKKVITAEADENIHIISILMNTYNISRIVVVKDNAPIGMITLKDFLPASIFYSSEFFEDSEQIFHTPFKNNIPKFIPKGARSFLIVQDIMTPRPLLMNKDDDAIESAKVMIRHRISGLPVIDNNLKLVGIITKTDILKTILKIPD
ncbi:MAG: CBS domain-containing protein [Candidatus Nitrosocosmicus sp.]